MAYVKNTEILIQEVWAEAPELTFQELPRDGGGDDGDGGDDSNGSGGGDDSYKHGDDGDDEGDEDSNLHMSTYFPTTGTVLGAGTEA